MAVRAEKNAFLQLLLRLLPRACDPVLGDAEVLRRAIEVVELEHLMGPRPSAAGAEAAEMLDRAPLQSPAIFDRRCLLSARRRDVPGAVAVRAKEFTLSGLEPEPRPRHAHAADSEFLCAGVAVMKLERRDGAAITAGFALSTAFAHELELQLLALLLLVAVRLRVATTAAMLDQLRVGDRSRWRFRRVVGASGDARSAPRRRSFPVAFSTCCGRQRASIQGRNDGGTTSGSCHRSRSSQGTRSRTARTSSVAFVAERSCVDRRAVDAAGTSGSACGHGSPVACRQ